MVVFTTHYIVIPAQAGIQTTAASAAERLWFFVRAAARKGLDTGLRRYDDCFFTEAPCSGNNGVSFPPSSEHP